jgi:hypothetical protein
MVAHRRPLRVRRLSPPLSQLTVRTSAITACYLLIGSQIFIFVAFSRLYAHEPNAAPITLFYALQSVAVLLCVFTTLAAAPFFGANPSCNTDLVLVAFGASFPVLGPVRYAGMALAPLLAGLQLAAFRRRLFPSADSVTPRLAEMLLVFVLLGSWIANTEVFLARNQPASLQDNVDSMGQVRFALFLGADRHRASFYR